MASDLIFLLFAFVVQTIAVLATTRFLNYNWLSSFNLAVALNDRGGPCIVLATLALESGIISENFFVTLILLAIVTSLSAGMWLEYVLKKGWPLLQEYKKTENVDETSRSSDIHLILKDV